MIPYPLHARRCLDLATAAAPAALQRAIDAAVESLQEEERRSASVARRQELAEAWLELMQRRQDWCGRYPIVLRNAQEDSPQHPSAAAPAGGRTTGLSLVDDEALARSLESRRMEQLLAPRLEQPLAELDGLMSSALGLPTVHPDRNPLRPEVFTRALRNLMQPAPRAEWPTLWMHHLAPPIGAELEKLYREALQLLRAANLEAATYRVLVAAPAAPEKPAPVASIQLAAGGGGGGGGVEVGSGGSGLGGPAWADLSHHELGDELFQHFLFARSEPSRQGLAPAYFAQVEQQLAAVEREPAAPYDPREALRHRSLPPVERPHRSVGTASPLDDAVWGRWAPARARALVRTRLKKDARQLGQVMGLEVVHKLVDQVGRDPRLLAPVREAVVALEPALLKLALVAPRFFGQEDHAGRRLVERVAERSFKYNDEFAGDFHAFFADVRLAFQLLNEAKIENEEPIAQALQHLEQRWAEQDALESPGRQVAVDAMYFAEAREAEAGQIAWSISERADLEGVPAVVQDFLFGPWSLVMAHARLSDDQPTGDPGGWNSVLSDLLWSVRPQQTLRDPARLITTIPHLLGQLRCGLAVLGQDTSDNDSFFDVLEQLHRPVLKLRAHKRQGTASPANPAHPDPALLSTERRQPQPKAGAPWLTPEEVKAVGFEKEAPGTPAVAPAGEEPAANADTLQQRCWVDLHADGAWRRAQLTWVSSHGSLYLFVSSGGRPHSMTRRTLERLLRSRLLRPVQAGAVVERAIVELSQQTLRPRELAA